MGNEERAAMYLELEKTVKELKELEWNLQTSATFISSIFLVESLDKTLNILESPDAEKFLNRETLISLIKRVMDLRAKKADLEKKLSIKITIE